MKLLLVVLEVAVSLLASWFLLFESVLYLELPAVWLTRLLPFAWLAVGLVLGRGWWRRARGLSGAERRFVLSIALVAGALVLLVSIASRPDPDDTGYLAGPLLSGVYPERPVLPDAFLLPVPGRFHAVPVVNENELWEPLILTIAQILGLDPLGAYHNLGPVLAIGLWCVVYALLLRRLRVPSRRVWLCLLATAALLLLDGDLHRTFGNMSLLRIWQGKVVALAVMLPAVLFLGWRFLANPKGARFLYLVAAIVVCSALNRSAMATLMLLVPSLSLAYCVAFGIQGARLRGALLALASLVPCLFFAAWLLFSGEGVSIITETAEAETARLPFRWAYANQSWHVNVFPIVVGDRWNLARDLVFLFLVPLLALRRPLGRLLPIYSVVIFVMAFSPLSGWLWSGVLGAIHWRFYYLLPLPLCFGLVTLCFHDLPGLRPTLRAVGAAAALLLLLAGLDRPVLSDQNGVFWKWPWSRRLDPRGEAIVRELAPLLVGDRVMARSDLAKILALTEPGRIDLAYSRLATKMGRIRRADSVIFECFRQADWMSDVHSFLRTSDWLITSRCAEDSPAWWASHLPGIELTPWRDGEDYRVFRVTAAVPPPRARSRPPRESEPPEGPGGGS